jgi:hypothetical protein
MLIEPDIPASGKEWVGQEDGSFVPKMLYPCY